MLRVLYATSILISLNVCMYVAIRIRILFEMYSLPWALLGIQGMSCAIEALTALLVFWIVAECPVIYLLYSEHFIETRTDLPLSSCDTR